MMRAAICSLSRYTLTAGGGDGGTVMLIGGGPGEPVGGLLPIGKAAPGEAAKLMGGPVGAVTPTGSLKPPVAPPSALGDCIPSDAMSRTAAAAISRILAGSGTASAWIRS